VRQHGGEQAELRERARPGEAERRGGVERAGGQPERGPHRDERHRRADAARERKVGRRRREPEAGDVAGDDGHHPVPAQAALDHRLAVRGPCPERAVGPLRVEPEAERPHADVGRRECAGEQVADERVALGLVAARVMQRDPLVPARGRDGGGVDRVVQRLVEVEHRALAEAAGERVGRRIDRHRH
jgi:hypothetical protein